MESILTSVKKLLGIAEECTDFDADIIMYINMALFALVQMGVGPGKGYAISGKENEWTEFVADPVKVEALKAYVAVKVRLLGFDPPQSSTTMEALKNTASEMEWRLNCWFDDSETADSTRKQIDYNDLVNIPRLDGVTLKGDVNMGLATKKDVEALIGGVVDGKF